MRWPTNAPLTRQPSRSRVPSHSSLLRLKVFTGERIQPAPERSLCGLGRLLSSGDTPERWPTPTRHCPDRALVESCSEWIPRANKRLVQRFYEEVGHAAIWTSQSKCSRMTTCAMIFGQAKQRPYRPVRRRSLRRSGQHFPTCSGESTFYSGKETSSPPGATGASLVRGLAPAVGTVEPVWVARHRRT